MSNRNVSQGVPNRNSPDQMGHRHGNANMPFNAARFNASAAQMVERCTSWRHAADCHSLYTRQDIRNDTQRTSSLDTSLPDGPTTMINKVGGFSIPPWQPHEYQVFAIYSTLDHVRFFFNPYH